VQEIAATLFNVPVHIPPAAEYVADGAARQAAWALSGTKNPPTWEIKGSVVKEINYQESVRKAYREAFQESYV
jgi:xylulokinase